MAWSTFVTGLDRGGHGIFDFVHRDPKTMLPYLSTTRTEGAERTFQVRSWQVPLSSGKVELLRRGQPFWDLLEGTRRAPPQSSGCPRTSRRRAQATRELSGMGTPDLLGTYGTFSFYTSDPNAFADEELSWEGSSIACTSRDGRVRAFLEGPEEPLSPPSRQM